MTVCEVPTDISSARLSKLEQVELATLYARRSAIDELIDSLQNYDRCRESRAHERTFKTA